MAKTRDSNVELLRIILMTMILLSHLITHGKYNFPGSNDALSIQDSTILTFTRYHVNTFIIISGFFGISLKFHKIFCFTIMIFFWTIMGSIIDFVVFREAAYGHIFNSLVNPFMSGWFIIQYFALMLYAPLLNKGIEVLNNQIFTIILIIFLTYVYGLFPSIISASSPQTLEFMAMYLIGRYIYRFQSRFDAFSWSKLIYISILLGGILLVMVVFSRSNYLVYNKLLSNQNPIVIMMGIALFLSFKKLRVRRIPFLNAVASGVIAAYLLTDCTLTGRWLDKWFYNISNDNAFILISISLFLVVALGTLEFLRKELLQNHESQIYTFLRDKWFAN